MLDIKFIRENVEEVKKAIKNKKIDLDLDALLEADKKRVEMLQEIEKLNAEKNKINTEIQSTKDEKEKEAILAKAKEIKLLLEQAEPGLKEAKEEFEKLLYKVPNIPSEDTPVGADETENKVLREVGKIPEFEFKPKEHWELGAELDLIDVERAVKVSGARFIYLKGDLVLLEFALMQFALSVLTDEKQLKKIIEDNKLDVSSAPFVPVLPPIMIRPEMMNRMARLDAEEMYSLERDGLNLIGSAEHTLGAMYADEILEAERLPIRLVGYSPAFRREAGSYNKDMKGMLRLHQFNKLEMESFNLPELALAEQNFIVAVQEYLMQALKLPYRVVQICTGDMGKPDHRQIDIETWMPGQNKYRETHTSDYNTDFQSRRLNTKLKRADGKIELVHMNDATAFSQRPLIAILENYQLSDGSVKIPEVLQKYMPGNLKVIAKE